MKMRHHRRARIAAVKWRRWVAIKHPIMGRTRIKPFQFSPVVLSFLERQDLVRDDQFCNHSADAFAHMVSAPIRVHDNVSDAMDDARICGAGYWSGGWVECTRVPPDRLLNHIDAVTRNNENTHTSIAETENKPK